MSSDVIQHECPICRTQIMKQGGGLWCDSCEREYWEDGGWWRCGVDGEPERVAGPNNTTDVTEIELGYVLEREQLEMAWDEYLCYALEVDREDVNQDELVHLSAVVARAVNSANEQGDSNANL